MDKELVSFSKFLSLILRHKPETIGMQLSVEGWMDVNALIENANKHGVPISLEQLHEIVAMNDKRRFALSDDGLSIRANQGHSIAMIELDLSPQSPPEILYHGTVEQFLASIRRQGLDKRSRNHVHLSADEATAQRVAQRRGRPVILTVYAQRMSAAGFDFYLSENQVWLTNQVPAEFIGFPTELNVT